jgi:hypothetical protein
MKPTCDKKKDCPEPVTHIDDRGFVYCAVHGPAMSDGYYRRCRKLRPHELNRINRGETIASY